MDGKIVLLSYQLAIIWLTVKPQQHPTYVKSCVFTATTVSKSAKNRQSGVCFLEQQPACLTTRGRQKHCVPACHTDITVFKHRLSLVHIVSVMTTVWFLQILLPCIYFCVQLHKMEMDVSEQTLNTAKQTSVTCSVLSGMTNNFKKALIQMTWNPTGLNFWAISLYLQPSCTSSLYHIAYRDKGQTKLP